MGGSGLMYCVTVWAIAVAVAPLTAAVSDTQGQSSPSLPSSTKPYEAEDSNLCVKEPSHAAICDACSLLPFSRALPAKHCCLSHTVAQLCRACVSDPLSCLVQIETSSHWQEDKAMVNHQDDSLSAEPENLFSSSPVEESSKRLEKRYGTLFLGKRPIFFIKPKSLDQTNVIKRSDDDLEDDELENDGRVDRLWGPLALGPGVSGDSPERSLEIPASEKRWGALGLAKKWGSLGLGNNRWRSLAMSKRWGSLGIGGWKRWGTLSVGKRENRFDDDNDQDSFAFDKDQPWVSEDKRWGSLGLSRTGKRWGSLGLSRSPISSDKRWGSLGLSRSLISSDKRWGSLGLSSRISNPDKRWGSLGLSSRTSNPDKRWGSLGLSSRTSNPDKRWGSLGLSSRTSNPDKRWGSLGLSRSSIGYDKGWRPLGLFRSPAIEDKRWGSLGLSRRPIYYDKRWGSLGLGTWRKRF